jgi:hypothetical protein
MADIDFKPLKMELDFMRYELTDHERFAIKPCCQISLEAYRE